MQQIARFAMLYKKELAECGIVCELKEDGVTLVMRSGEHAIETFWVGNSVAIMANPPQFVNASQKRLLADIIISLTALAISERESQGK